MKISEAIKEIIRLRGLSVFDNYKIFFAMLADLSTDTNSKELSIFKKAVDDKILKICSDNNLRDYNKIAKIRMRLEDDGFAEQTINFVIESFALSLGWNYTSKDKEIKQQIQSQQTQSQQTQSQHTQSQQIQSQQTQSQHTQSQQIQSQQIQTSGMNKKQNVVVYVVIILIGLFVLPILFTNSNKNNVKEPITYSEPKTINTNYNHIEKIEEQNKNTENNQVVDNTNYIEVKLDENVLKKLGYDLQQRIRGDGSLNSLITTVKKNGEDVVNLDIPSTYNYNGKYYKIGQIAENVFAGCKSFKSVIIPDSITEIGAGAFYGCESLISLTISDSVTKIGENAFANCKALTSVTIPDSVTQIGKEAFTDCKLLTSIIIPNSVTQIGENAFYNVDTIYYNGKAKGSTWGANKLINNNYDYIEVKLNGSVLEQLGYDIKYEYKGEWNQEIYLKKNGEDVVNLDIPSIYNYNGKKYKILQIDKYAFHGCKSLRSITIPDSITEIGEYAFFYCESLTSITIPDSITQINLGVFCSCSSLTSVTIPDSVTKIDTCAFFDCSSLRNLIIPNSVKEIGERAFRSVPHIEYYGTANVYEYDKYWGANSMN